ncbi:MAG: hypothetical protein J5I93_30020 [Pirellulaceae bacterium]|nr:hypothetical protein [Pirellulaceae bacterium]
MTASIEALGIYLHLVRASGHRRRPHVRDRLLVIAADLAQQQQLPRVAALCRRLILDHNAHHLIGHWPTVADARQQAAFQNLLRQIQRRYPLERAEQLLSLLAIERGREREAYFSDEEYAAALLGYSLERLEEEFGPAG